MTQITKTFELAQLAEASYANLQTGMTPSALITQLRNADFNMEFSLTQATEFAANWRVVSHQANTASDFSGTLFEYIGNDPNSGYTNGELVYAARGTEGFVSLDLWVADLGDIVYDGLAHDQTVDMYNDWKRITAGVGQAYQPA